MHDRHKTAGLLMLRPWHGVSSGDTAYAHFDALPMRKDPGLTYGRYGDYSVLYSGDDARQVLHLDNFRFQCQIDNRHADSYAWRWGYRPDRQGIFSAADFERYGPSIQALQKGLDKLSREDGYPDSIGRLIVRLARVLKLGGIAVLETSSDGSFNDGLQVCWTLAPAEFGKGVGWINDLASALHQACAQRMTRSA